MLTRALLVLLVLSGAIWPAAAEDTKVVALGVANHVVTEAELAGGARSRSSLTSRYRLCAANAKNDGRSIPARDASRC
jgi:hypothetical protein